MKTLRTYTFGGIFAFLFLLLAGGTSAAHALTPGVPHHDTSVALHAGDAGQLQAHGEEAAFIVEDEEEGNLASARPAGFRTSLAARSHTEPRTAQTLRPALHQARRIHAILSVYLN